LRRRVIAAVARDGMSCRAPAKQFGISEWTAVKWRSAFIVTAHEGRSAEAAIGLQRSSRTGIFWRRLGSRSHPKRQRSPLVPAQGLARPQPDRAVFAKFKIPLRKTGART
jgi:transposase-like protein